MSMSKKINIVKMQILHKLLLSMIQSQSKSQQNLLSSWQIDLKFRWNEKNVN